MTEHHPVVPHDHLLQARTALLVKEKEFTRLRDELSRQRRDLPGKPSPTTTSSTPTPAQRQCPTCSPGRSQLIVYHFKFDPDWDDGCPHCSFWADNFNPNTLHLADRDVRPRASITHRHPAQVRRNPFASSSSP
jgi:predicted dithiol-disulfide oxidoreductase (DUF899 family)